MSNYEYMRAHEDMMAVFWTDNPVSDAERWSASGDAWTEEHAPICECCGERITDRHCYEVDDDGAHICNSCKKRLIRIVKAHSPYLADVVENLMEQIEVETPVIDEAEAW